MHTLVCTKKEGLDTIVKAALGEMNRVFPEKGRDMHVLERDGC